MFETPSPCYGIAGEFLGLKAASSQQPEKARTSHSCEVINSTEILQELKRKLFRGAAPR